MERAGGKAEAPRWACGCAAVEAFRLLPAPLGAVASSTIGVAGTVFSITIVFLSLAAGRMGPCLPRNFVHDRGNQFMPGTSS